MKLKSHRTYILPTAPCLLIGFVLFIEFIVSLTFGHPFAYTLTFLSFGVIIVSAFHTNYSLDKIKYLSVKNNLLEQGQLGSITIYIDIPKNFEKRGLICNFEGQEHLSNQVVGGEANSLKVSLLEKKRGVSPFPRLKIQTTYPFGIFKAWRYLDIGCSLNTYPQKFDGKVSDNHASSSESLEGESSIDNDNRDEFFEHKKFLETDSWKQIDWKAFARGRGLLTKKFTGSSEKSRIFEISKDYSEEDLQRAVRFLFTGYESNTSTTLLYDNHLISSGADLLHLETCLKNLCSYGERNV